MQHASPASRMTLVISRKLYLLFLSSILLFLRTCVAFTVTINSVKFKTKCLLVSSIYSPILVFLWNFTRWICRDAEIATSPDPNGAASAWEYVLRFKAACVPCISPLLRNLGKAHSASMSFFCFHLLVGSASYLFTFLMALIIESACTSSSQKKKKQDTLGNPQAPHLTQLPPELDN